MRVFAPHHIFTVAAILIVAGILASCPKSGHSAPADSRYYQDGWNAAPESRSDRRRIRRVPPHKRKWTRRYHRPRSAIQRTSDRPRAKRHVERRAVPLPAARNALPASVKQFEAVKHGRAEQAKQAPSSDGSLSRRLKEGMENMEAPGREAQISKIPDQEARAVAAPVLDSSALDVRSVTLVSFRRDEFPTLDWTPAPSRLPDLAPWQEPSAVAFVFLGLGVFHVLIAMVFYSRNVAERHRLVRERLRQPAPDASAIGERAVRIAIAAPVCMDDIR